MRHCATKISLSIFVTLAVSYPAVSSGVPPPYDAAKRLPSGTLDRALALLDEGEETAALSVLEHALADEPTAGDADYAIAWAARSAARLCQLDLALYYYQRLRRDFSGYVSRGAYAPGRGNPHRNWDTHLHITRAYAGFCNSPRTSNIVEQMKFVDLYLPRLPASQRYINTDLVRIDSRTAGVDRGADVKVTVVGAWRYDETGQSWVHEPQHDGLAFIRADATQWSPDDIAGRLGTDGLYAIIWHDGAQMATSYASAGKMSCDYHGPRAALERSRKATRDQFRCTPRGLEFVPSFEGSLDAGELPEVLDAGERLLRQMENTSLPVDVSFAMVTGSLAQSGLTVNLESEWGRVARFRIDEVRYCDTTLGHWIPVFLPITPQSVDLLSECSEENRRKVRYLRPRPRVPLRDFIEMSLASGWYQVVFTVDGVTKYVTVQQGFSSSPRPRTKRDWEVQKPACEDRTAN